MQAQGRMRTTGSCVEATWENPSAYKRRPATSRRHFLLPIHLGTRTLCYSTPELSITCGDGGEGFSFDPFGEVLYGQEFVFLFRASPRWTCPSRTAVMESKAHNVVARSPASEECWRDTRSLDRAQSMSRKTLSVASTSARSCAYLELNRAPLFRKKSSIEIIYDLFSSLAHQRWSFPGRTRHYLSRADREPAGRDSTEPYFTTYSPSTGVHAVEAHLS